MKLSGTGSGGGGGGIRRWPVLPGNRWNCTRLRLQPWRLSESVLSEEVGDPGADDGVTGIRCCPRVFRFSWVSWSVTEPALMPLLHGGLKCNGATAVRPDELALLGGWSESVLISGSGELDVAFLLIFLRIHSLAWFQALSLSMCRLVMPSAISAILAS